VDSGAVPFPRPQPRLDNGRPKLNCNGTCVIQICLSLWVHPKGSTKGVMAHLSPHISSILKSNGEDVKVVQELLRHSTARMTLDTYTQALTPQKRAGHSKVVGIIRPKERVFSVCREGKGVSDVTC